MEFSKSPKQTEKKHYLLTDALSGFNEAAFIESMEFNQTEENEQSVYIEGMEINKSISSICLWPQEETNMDLFYASNSMDHTMENEEEGAIILAFPSLLNNHSKLHNYVSHRTPATSEDISIDSEKYDDVDSYIHAMSLMRVNANCANQIQSPSEMMDESIDSLTESIISSDEIKEDDSKLTREENLRSASCNFHSNIPTQTFSYKSGQLRFVLHSLLIQNAQSKETFTAIRQRSSDPNTANILDEWLLYDSKFSLDNLEMGTLQDILLSNKGNSMLLLYKTILISK